MNFIDQHVSRENIYDKILLLKARPRSRRRYERTHGFKNSDEYF